MVIQNPGTNQPKQKEGDRMTPAVALARSLERKERSRGFSQPHARERIAGKLRIGVGTFENIVRNRVKGVDAAVRDRIRDLLISEIQSEITRLDHELQMVRQIGCQLAMDQIREIEAHLGKAKELLASAVS